MKRGDRILSLQRRALKAQTDRGDVSFFAVPYRLNSWSRAWDSAPSSRNLFHESVSYLLVQPYWKKDLSFLFSQSLLHREVSDYLPRDLGGDKQERLTSFSPASTLFATGFPTTRARRRRRRTGRVTRRQSARRGTASTTGPAHRATGSAAPVSCQ